MDRCGGEHLWLLLLYSFVLLDKNEPKNQGRHHRSQRTKRALPRHVGQTYAPNPVKYQHSHSQHLRFPAGMEVYIEWPAAASNDYDPETLQTAAWYLITITPFPKGISQHYTPAPYRHRGPRPAISYTARGLFPCRRFASSRGGTSLPRAERGGSDPFMTD